MNARPSVQFARRAVLVVAALFLATSCASMRAATGPNGEPITLELTVGQMPGQNNADQITQVINFLGPDLEEILRDTGYNVVQQPNPQAFQPGPLRYNVVVLVTNYNPGSKAARMLVGFGAGTLVLDTKLQVFQAPGQMILERADSVGSSRDWDYAARKTNLNVARDVTRLLSGSR